MRERISARASSGLNAPSRPRRADHAPGAAAEIDPEPTGCTRAVAIGSYLGGTYGSGAPGLIGGYFWNEARWSSKIFPAGYRTQKC